jgi:hypothetical protein
MGMNSTGEKTGYRIILLLVVGLTAFSSAMKELKQVQQFSLEASRLIAQWTDKIAPSEVPQPVVVKQESCEIKQSTPSVELPWLANVADNDAADTNEARATTTKPHRAKPGSAQLAKLNKLHRLNIDPVKFEVRIAPDQDADSDDVIISDLPLSSFKAKARKHGAIRISPRDRELLLKTVTRSINLRSAS